MKQWLKKITGLDQEEKQIKKEREELEKEKQRIKKQSPEESRREALAKEKEEASAKGEPWVAVLDTQVNPENIKNGFFEIDWNNEFIEQLLDAGYKGETNEQIVDAWFRTIVTQMLDEEGLDTDREIGYINVVPIDKGRSSVS